MHIFLLPVCTGYSKNTAPAANFFSQRTHCGLYCCLSVDVMVCATNNGRVVGPRSRHCNKGKFRVVFYSYDDKCTSDLWGKAANQSNRGKSPENTNKNTDWGTHKDNKTEVKHISF